MQVLTEAEALKFCEDNGFIHGFAMLGGSPSRSIVTVDVGERCRLAKLFTDLSITEPDSVVCLNITDWAVWPSAQNMDLFYAYRRSLGEPRLLTEAHFHIFTATEANEFRNILHLALISLFDVAGASTTTGFRFYASHDEWIDSPWHDGAPWREELEGWFGVK